MPRIVRDPMRLKHPAGTITILRSPSSDGETTTPSIPPSAQRSTPVSSTATACSANTASSAIAQIPPTPAVPVALARTPV